MSASVGQRIARWLTLTTTALWLSASLAGDAQEVDQALLTLLKKTVEQADSFEDRFDAEVWLMAKSTQLARYIPDTE